MNKHVLTATFTIAGAGTSAGIKPLRLCRAMKSKAAVYVWEGQTIEHKNPMTTMRTLAMAFRERGILASFMLAEKEIA
jgi:hypothetical protein